MPETDLDIIPNRLDSPDDETAEVRGKRLERQSWVRQELLRKDALHRQTVERDTGEKIEILWSFSRLPPELVTPAKNSRFRLTLFVPGMFQMDEIPGSPYAANYGNHPLEINLDSGLLTGDINAVMVLKAEGLNDISYQDASGKGAGQKKVAAAAVEVFQAEIEKFCQSNGVSVSDLEIRILGHSEGATQAASIAAELLRQRIGQVKELTVIMPAGLSGIAPDRVCSPADFLRDAIARRLISSEPTKKSRQLQFGYKISAEKIKELDRRFAIGGVNTYVDSEADKRNVGRWLLRLAGGKRWADFAAKLGIAENVPFARLIEADRRNPDYQTVVSAGVPLLVVAGSRDVLFLAGEVRRRLDDLSKIANSHVAALFVDGDHVFSHYYPSGVAHALELLRRQTGFEKTH